ncbi:MAG: serpin family protein [Butyrivibrio sp.]|nr:serpin family protein [Butyrivibrio sp.]
MKILKKAAALALLTVLPLGAAGCGTAGRQPIELTEPAGAGEVPSGETPKLDGAFEEGSADFAVSLLKNSADTEKNFMVSPLSVQLALAMTANGADGATKKQMEQVLCGGMDIDTLNRCCKLYTDGLADTQNTRFSIADSIWIRDGFDVSGDFLKTNSAFYDASVYKAPFDEQTVKDINKWVYDKTHKMIDGVIEEIDEDAVMYLINAVAFDAEWQEIYEESQIRKSTFTEENGKQYERDMMFSEENYYLEDDMATGFMKNYLDGYAFVGLLPKEGVTVDEYIASLDGGNFLKMLQNKKNTSVDAGLPKFESEYSAELSEALSEMGMPAAFDSLQADFSKMNAAMPLYVGAVVHKTYINVDERGTKAGAVTSVEIKCEGAPETPTERYEVYLNRPFVYAVVDLNTNLPIFIGAVRSLE